MKLVTLINGYYPRIGGAERVVTALNPILQRKGVDVHVVTRRFPGMAPYEEVGGIPVHRLAIPGPKALASFSYTRNALRKVAQLRPDVIHVHDLFSTATTGALVKQFNGIPIVATIHRSGPLGDIYRLHRKTLGNMRWRFFAKTIEKFVAISREIDQELASLGIPAYRRVSIPNGVDTDRFRPVSIERRGSLRSGLGLGREPVAIFVGRLAPEKRVNHLLSIWPEVRKHVPGATLLVLGEGPEEACLKHSMPEGVRFEGGIDDVVPYLQAVDVFVLPSIAEGFSIAALEAQAAGVATIMTDVGGATDLIQHNENGWLLPPDDLEKLKTGMIALLGDAELRQRLALAGRARIESQFSLEVMADHLVSVYSNLTEGLPVERQGQALKSE